MTELGAPLLDLRDFELWRSAGAGAGERRLLRGLDLRLQRGEWVALLGANGAGKSSLLRYLAGSASPVSATTALVFQDPDDGFATASVAEEIRLGRPDLDAADWLNEFGLIGREPVDPRLLSAGEKQRLALAIALAGEPALLLCDEPTTLQDAATALWLRERLVRWRAETGGTLLFATQSHDEVRLADRALLLEGGRLVAAGPPAALLARPEVAELLGTTDAETQAGRGKLWAGSTLTAAWPGTLTAGPAEAPLLDLQDVACRFGAQSRGLSGITARVVAGERIGVTGPNGSGKSTLLAIAAGLRRPDRGRCWLSGRALYARGEPDLDHGLVALAPQFPEYMFSRPTVAAEIALDPALGAAGIPQVLSAAGLAPEVAERNPHDLSSGERRSLAVALVLLSGRPLLLLDEPTAALDARARARVVSLLAAAPATAAIVIASHDEDLLVACGCRLLRLTAGGLLDASGSGN